MAMAMSGSGSKQAPPRPPRRVLIVGAGSSGLTAAKACLEEGLVPVCLEKTLDVGGLWNYSDDPPAPGTAGIYANLVINTCKEMMAFSDFPVPDEVPQFMTHGHVLRYFRAYAAHFRLLPHVRFNAEVRRVRKADDYEETGRWVVTYVTHASDACPVKCVNGGRGRGRDRDDVGSEEKDDRRCSGTAKKLSEPEAETGDGEWWQNPPEAGVRGSGECREVSEEFEGVMICCGHHTVPYVPALPGIDLFQGRVIHSQEYKRPERFAGKRVLVMGQYNSSLSLVSNR